MYFQLVEISSQEVEEMFTPHQTAILDLYYIPVYMQTNLYTDDTFKFNQVLKEMTMTIEDDSIGPFKEEHDKHLQQFRAGSSQYEFADNNEFVNFIAGMKRWVFMDTLKLVFEKFKTKEWAKISLQQVIRQAYILKEKFSEDEQDTLGDMLSELKKVNSIIQKQTEVRTNRDEKIKSGLLDGVETAKDGRAVAIVADSAHSKWASRQSGL